MTSYFEWWLSRAFNKEGESEAPPEFYQPGPEATGLPMLKYSVLMPMSDAYAPHPDMACEDCKWNQGKHPSWEDRRHLYQGVVSYCPNDGPPPIPSPHEVEQLKLIHMRRVAEEEEKERRKKEAIEMLYAASSRIKEETGIDPIDYFYMEDY